MRLGKRKQRRDEKRKKLGERKMGEKMTKHYSIESKEEGKKGFKNN